ncbi:hypothetical protein [Acetobacter sp. DsW_063]|uniref:hypothetical protein n=1 Tax=Acetobacter sp. DsW_063 TaxID=1514894 RepID=UPI000A367314|nr:hypothetical protein [Acetobacter sp. DsW_063]OUJ16494.1 hypothetical protein HK28_12520 [Acetobacter sp. DsW_063]
MSALVDGDRPRERMEPAEIGFSLGLVANMVNKRGSDALPEDEQRERLKTAAHALKQIWDDLDAKAVLRERRALEVV